jgi:hypothetical protein
LFGGIMVYNFVQIDCMKKITTLFYLLISVSLYAQEKNEANGKVGATYSNAQGVVDGFTLLPFKLTYHIYEYNGVHLNYRITSEWDNFSNFWYKGQSYGYANVPEIKQVHVTSATIGITVTGGCVDKTLKLPLEELDSDHDREILFTMPAGCDLTKCRITDFQVTEVEYKNFSVAALAIENKTKQSQSPSVGNNGDNIGSNTTRTLNNAGVISSTPKPNQPDAQHQNELAKQRADAAIEALKVRQENQAATQAVQTQMISDATKYAATVVNGLMADAQRRNEEKAANEERQRIIDEKNVEIGKTVLQYYTPIAETGDEQAIFKVAQGYDYIKDPNEKYAFLINMYDKFKSETAYINLKNHYNWQMNTKKSEANFYLKRGIVNGSLALACFGGLYVLSNSPNVDDTTLYAVGIPCTIGAIVFPFLSFSGFLDSGYKSDTDYVLAKQKLEALNARRGVSFNLNPMYNSNFKTFSFSAKVIF